MEDHLSNTVGFVSWKRPFSTEAQIELTYRIENGFFRLNYFRLRIPTLADSVEKLATLRLDPPPSSRKTQSRKNYTFFFTDRIVHPTTKHTPTRPHGAHLYQVPHCSITQGADAGVAVTAVASRSKSAWCIPGSARQPRSLHDGSSARY